MQDFKEAVGLRPFGRTTKLLTDIILEVNSGELLALLDASGCGKNSPLRILGGLDVADSGKLFFHGEHVRQRDARERLLAANTIYIALRRGRYLRSFAYHFIELCSPKLDEAAIRAGIAPLLEAGQ